MAFYSSAIDAWFNTALERDKSLLSLSSAGIAALVAVLYSVGAPHTVDKILYAMAVIAFVICLCFVLDIFSKNKSYLESIIKDDQAKTKDLGEKLAKLDKIANCAFLAGVMLSIGIGIASIYWNSQKDNDMTKESNKTVIKGIAQDSFCNAPTLQKRSFENANALKKPITNQNTQASGNNNSSKSTEKK